ncbi:hypothetical protein JKF63_00256 [Porcisia hertigi]|uniref:Membrane-bound acid phosphatase n=1 Tax=Porcisia hertigi TaxID=2761500 RepID=A0A836GXZ5_9TRYP|nr:hypothetical protein JKF63_00256 [Porcisia hertigi]
MLRRSAFLYWCAVAMAMTACAAVVSATPVFKVELVQVVHRHGARTPIVSFNETLICGTEFPCGHLNHEGQTMLVNLGKYLRHRYMEDPAVVREPYFPYDFYNVSISHTRSTDVPRTLQSASALLRGLFPNMSAFFPVIHTVAMEQDVLLHSSMVPMLRARYGYAEQELRSRCDPVLDRKISFDQLQAVASEVHLQGFCANYTLRSRCAERLCDVGQSYESTGQLTSFPLLGQHLDDLCAVTATISHFLFAYNASNSVHRSQGAPYYHLSSLLVSNMRAHQRRTTAPSYKLYQYSAHDSTIAPLASSLGDNSMEAMLPPFGTAFIMELLSRTDSQTALSSSFHVRLVRGHSGKSSASNFTFALGDFKMRCQDAAGKTYIAEDNICPFADFERFINSTAPTSPMGTCYIDPGLLDRMNCPADAVSDNRSLSEDCLFYRKYCSKYACGTGHLLDAIDYGCHRIPSTTSQPASPPMSSGGIAALSIALFMAGGLASVGRMRVWKRYRSTQRAKDVTLLA